MANGSVQSENVFPCLIFHPNLFLLLLIVGCQAQLRIDYYRNTCPNVESIVRGVKLTLVVQHIIFTRGPSYAVELGRLDGRVSTKASVRHHLPHPEFKLERLNQMQGGAHTIGFSRCNQSSKRIYNFKRRKSIDHTLNPAYAKQLKQVCPKNVDPRLAIDIDPVTPRTFDNQYYKNLQQGRGLLASDQALFTHKRTRDLVNLFASNNTAFEASFVSATTKLGRIGVKTGNQGEIRRDSTMILSNSSFNLFFFF
uniref:peroxidase n=1 Tax=Glycine max TaxID=3847 RepID=A0A0R0GK31_SOYBN